MRRSNTRPNSAQLFSKNDNNAKTSRGPELPPRWWGLLRHVAWLHEPGQTAGEAVRQAWGGPQRLRRAKERSSGCAVEPHPKLSAGGLQDLHRDQFSQQLVGHQQQRDLLGLLPLLQAERGVCKSVPVTQAEIRWRESHLPHPLELHLPHLWSHRGPRSHTPVLPAGAAPGGCEDAAAVQILVVDPERLVTLKRLYIITKTRVGHVFMFTQTVVGSQSVCSLMFHIWGCFWINSVPVILLQTCCSAVGT